MKRKIVIRSIIALVSVVALLAIGAVAYIYLAPESAAQTFFNFERWNAGLVRKEIVLADGNHYVYLEGGRGEPLILLHGFGGNKDNFDRTAKFLTPHYRVIIPDHLGFGESDKPADADYSPTAQAKRLHVLADALGAGSFHIGGNSMGGQIALTYAELYTADVRSLWLIDPAGVWSAPKSEVRTLIETTGHNPLLVTNEDEFIQLVPFVMADPPFVPRPIMNVLAKERIDNFELEKKIFTQISTDSLEERVRGLTAPTLIVWGDQDRTINVATAEILHGLLPNSHVIIMPDIGHLPMIERPQQTADDYLRFRGSL